MKSVEDAPTTTQSGKAADKKHSSVPPQTPPPPVGPKPGSESKPVGPKSGAGWGDIEYSTVSQDWIEKKRSGAQKATAMTTTATAATSSNSKKAEDGEPPALPPRSELADQFDEDLYDLPIIHDDVKVLPSSKATSSSSSITVDNNLYQSAALSKPNSSKPPPVSNPSVKTTAPESSETTYDVIVDVNTVKSPIEKKVDVVHNLNSRTSPVERKTPSNSPLSPKKGTTLPKPSLEAMYDVIPDVHAGKSLTMPASNRRSPSPEYAVIRKSPVLPRAPTKSSVKSDSPAISKVSASASSKEPSDSEYDLPVTARQAELRINSPPSPMLSGYAKLQSKDGTRTDKQEWKIPKQTSDSKKKTARVVSVDTTEPQSSVDKAIAELQKGLDESSDQTKNRTQSLDLTSIFPKKSDPSSGEMGLDWDDSDMTGHGSSVQQSWMEKHQQNLMMRSYEEVQLPVPEGKEKLPPGWSKVIGEDGVYYWHVKSGKTQWTVPTEPVNTDKVSLYILLIVSGLLKCYQL